MDWLGPVAVSTGVVLALCCLALLGWRGRLSRQSHLPAPVSAPAKPGRPVFDAEGQYVVTTTAGDWLDRVGVHGLGMRSNARVAVYDHGVLFRRAGAPDVYIPRSALQDVRLESGMAGKFVEKDGLVAIGWRLGDTAVDTGFRTRRADDKHLLLAAVAALAPRAQHSPYDKTPHQTTPHQTTPHHSKETP